MTDLKTARMASSLAVSVALTAWARAPVAHRAVAGAFVAPILAALEAIDDELRDIRRAATPEIGSV